MQRPNRDSTLMEIAAIFSVRSTCTRSHVGSVIAMRGRVLSTGYNGAPAGLEHCEHACTCIHLPMSSAPRQWHHEPGCPSSMPCLIAVHAEANAIAFAARNGVAVEGAELYTTLSPCLACAMLIINAGIVRVVFRTQYRDPAGVNLLLDANVIIVHWNE